MRVSRFNKSRQAAIRTAAREKERTYWRLCWGLKGVSWYNKILANPATFGMLVGVAFLAMCSICYFLSLAFGTEKSIYVFASVGISIIIFLQLCVWMLACHKNASLACWLKFREQNKEVAASMWVSVIGYLHPQCGERHLDYKIPNKITAAEDTNQEKYLN